MESDTKLFSHCSICHDERTDVFYVTGGFSPKVATAVYSFEMSEKAMEGKLKLSRLPRMLHERMWHSTIIHNDYLLATGSHGNITSAYSCEVFQFSKQTWTETKGKLQLGRYAHSSVAAGGNIYVIAGLGVTSN